MESDPIIEKVTNDNFDEILPLIREYQTFYQVKEIDDEKNRRYFSQFVNSNENGVLHILRYKEKAIGFTTIYNSFSSSRAETVAVLNDLYVQLQYRGEGFGKMLVNHAIGEAKNRGYSRLQWLTSQDNDAAQKLYDGLDASKSAWFFYAKAL